jgi:hypothetical protein
MIEVGDWQTKFGAALSFLKDERKKMLKEEVYRDTQKLFEWAEETAKKSSEISAICGGGHLAILVCDELDRTKGGFKVMDNIIMFAGAQGIRPEINTDSTRVRACTALTTYLDQRGLGNKMITGV